MVRKKKIIMVVDDDIAILDSFDALFGEDYDLLATTRGSEALDLYKEKRPQLIFLDIRLADMNGIDVLKKIREKDKKIKIVIITGTNHKFKPEAEKIGIDGYCRKPLDVNYMEKLTEDLILKEEKLR